ncbi:2TM domain-containing protein [Flavobacterium sp. ZT3R18]|uniref:2TM domain-containing protein n=1 Tax=Flavobacterium sp. ZT3R18 TaxID=2594429 RepID=UPI00117AB483|nr:2TM domain-containing protein [Flavobacterium sp. ZT3R18]TRX36870.1 2TM domain-containing protein [Flavobacterium sp. ZT3R18]
MEIHRKEYQENELVEIARRKVKKLKGFYIHAFIYLIGVMVFILKEYLGVPFNFFALKHINFFVLAIWSTVFFISAIDILITYQFFGENWEERTIKSIMEKESKKQIWK